MDNLQRDIAVISSISAVPAILDVICRTTGMGFAAVARVTDKRWIACSVLDQISFGLKAGGELQLDTTICNEIRDSAKEVVINEVATDPVYCNHHTPRHYGFQSYISMPIFLVDGRFFGTLCAIDPKPAVVNTPEIVGMFKLFAELIAFHIDAADKLARTEANLLLEREASKIRELFIGVMGHDLRTPLNAISMGTVLLREKQTKLDEEMALGLMEKSIARMSDLIEDALDFTRGRLGGGITLTAFEAASVEPVLRQIVSEIRMTYPKRVVETEFSLTEAVQHDSRRFGQMFNNLIANAITYGTPDQPVKVTAKTADCQLTVSVANAGTPISPAALGNIFEPFKRGDVESPGGLGLGLFIASQIANSHHGRLTVTSDATETCFTFTMPLKITG